MTWRRRSEFRLRRKSDRRNGSKTLRATRRMKISPSSLGTMNVRYQSPMRRPSKSAQSSYSSKLKTKLQPESKSQRSPNLTKRRRQQKLNNLRKSKQSLKMNLMKKKQSILTSKSWIEIKSHIIYN